MKNNFKSWLWNSFKKSTETKVVLIMTIATPLTFWYDWLFMYSYIDLPSELLCGVFTHLIPVVTIIGYKWQWRKL